MAKCFRCGKALNVIKYTETWDKENNPVDVTEEYACLKCKVVYLEFELPSEYEIVR